MTRHPQEPEDQAKEEQGGKAPGGESPLIEHALEPEALPHAKVQAAPASGESEALRKAPAAVRRSMPLALSIMLGLLLASLTGWLLYNLMWFILLLYLCVVFATIVDAPVQWLKRYRIPRAVSAVAILLGAVGVLVGLGYLITLSLSQQAGVIGEAMNKLPQRLAGLMEYLKRQFPGLRDQLQHLEQSNSLGGWLPSASSVFSNLSWAFNTITFIVVAFFTVLYMVLEGPDHLRAARRLLPRETRLEATRLFEALAKAHRGWFLAHMGNVTSASILVSTGLWIVGVPANIVLGIIAGLGELVPNVGPVIGALPAILFTVLVKPDLIWEVLLMFLIVQTIQSYTITPHMMKIGVELPVLVTIVSVIAMGLLFGVLGVLVAIPLVADGMVAWNYINTILEKEAEDNDVVNAVPTPARSAPAPDTPTPATRRRFWQRRDPGERGQRAPQRGQPGDETPEPKG